MGKNKTKIQKWLFAAKINSSPKLLVAFLFGSSMGIHASGWNGWIFFLGFLFTVFLLCYIVFLNDYADQEIDQIKRNLFPDECSYKTIPDNILPASQILVAGISFGVLSLLVSLLLSIIVSSIFILGLGIVCILIFYFYSLPPFYLNYRGGGELLEMIGVGLVLPAFHFATYAQVLELANYAPYILCYILLSLSSAVASGLSDEVSDRQGGKTTIVTTIGNRNSKRLIIFLFVMSVIPVIYLGFYSEIKLNIIVLFLILVSNLYQMGQIVRLSSSAETSKFDILRVFKSHLHNGIWGTMIFLSADLVCKRYGIF